MYNSLIARAIVPIAIAVTGFVIFCCIMLYALINADMQLESLKHINNLADTVLKSTHYAMMEDDRQALSNIVNNVSELDDVDHIHIYSPDHQVVYSGSVSKHDASATSSKRCSGIMPEEAFGSERMTRTVDDATCGANLAVSVPLMNQPKCSTAECHFHSADEPVLGYLDIGLSQVPLEKTLALLRYRMIVFSVMVLFITIGGVTAILRRSVFLPVLSLTDYVQRATDGVKANDLPELGKGLGSLSSNVPLLVKQRDHAWQRLQELDHESQTQTAGDTELTSGS